MIDHGTPLDAFIEQYLANHPDIALAYEQELARGRAMLRGWAEKSNVPSDQEAGPVRPRP